MTDEPPSSTLGRLRRAVFGAPRSVQDPSIFHKMALIPFLAWIGLVVHFLRPMFDYAWFVGALGAGLTYWIWKRAK